MLSLREVLIIIFLPIGLSGYIIIGGQFYRDFSFRFLTVTRKLFKVLIVFFWPVVGAYIIMTAAIRQIKDL